MLEPIDHCSKENSLTSIGVGTFIIIAIILTYLPQYYKIVKNNSTEGISYFFLLLGNLSNFTNFFGSLLLNYQIIDCCSYVSVSKCTNLLLPIYQMFTPWVSIYVLYIIFLIYDSSIGNEYRKAFVYFSLFTFFGVILLGIVGLIMIIHFQSMHNHVNLFGNALNVISTITCIFTFLPQIIKTYNIKKLGNLSLISLAFQAPGSLIVFFYQSFIVHAPISIGIPYLFSGMLQMTLFIISYYYYKKEKKLAIDILINIPSEHDYLLQPVN